MGASRVRTVRHSLPEIGRGLPVNLGELIQNLAAAYAELATISWPGRRRADLANHGAANLVLSS
jgi:hypothetical protein